jgi:adenine/guanine/hypoxanthine permease
MKRLLDWSMTDHGKKYKWLTLGDLNGFFGLMFDNLTVLSFMSGILVCIFNFPANIVYGKMFPGTAFGVFFGDIVYTWMAFRLAKKTGNANATAMPLGLDTPSTIGMTLVVLGPAFLGLKAEGFSEGDAAMMTWYIGMATMVFIGIIKVIFSFVGPWVQRVVPRAGLLGSLAGIGLALIGLIPLVDVFSMPLVGMISLGLILYTLVARISLPRGLPGVFTAIVIGTALYYVLAPLGWGGGTISEIPKLELHFGLPIPTLGFLEGMSRALKYLPIAIPFGLLTVVGGINVTESARVAGDDYSTRDILLTEAVATLIAGLCGGVAQSTPYIGQPAYKRMGARAGYTLLTGIFIGLGGILGFVSFFVELIPRAVLAPILVFVALEIIVQSFDACPKRHSAAVALAFFPSLACLLSIKLGNPEFVPAEIFSKLLTLPGKGLPELLVTVALGNGFIVTAMLWGAFLAEMIDRRLKRSAFYLLILGVLSFFGIIHSALPDGQMYLPWLLDPFFQKIPYQFAFAYVLLAVVLLVLSYTKSAGKPVEEM